MYGYTSQLRLSALADAHCDHRMKDKDLEHKPPGSCKSVY